MSHTPGPWESDGFLVAASNGREIGHTGLLGRRHPSVDGQSGAEEDEANARLIAAAPELLSACELALSCSRERTDDKTGICDACEMRLTLAIAKAKGGKS